MGEGGRQMGWWAGVGVELREGLVGAGGVFTYVLSYIMPSETRLNRREKSGA